MSKTFYGVLRLDSSMRMDDPFQHGAEIKLTMPKGQYLMPVFDTREAAEKYADGRFDIIDLSGTENQ